MPITPGPWNVREVYDDPDIKYGIGWDGQGTLIALVQDRATSMDSKDAEANAKAIAAVPDLIEALREIVKNQEPIGSGLAVVSVRLAQAALDKVETGE